MFPFFNNYPGTDLHEIDLAYVLKLCANVEANTKELQTWAATHEEEYEDLKNKVDGLINNLVDVIVPWDSSVSYHIFSIVEYQGTNYIAVQDVPIGTMITNTEYWQPADTVVQQINAIGAVVDDFIDNNKFYVTPEEFGAVGDGVTDDTQAFVDAMNSGIDVQCFGGKTYAIKELIIDKKCNIYGNGATLKAYERCDFIVQFPWAEENSYSGIFDGFILDGNLLAKKCMEVGVYRKIFSNLALNDPDPDGGYGMYAYNLGQCGGTRFYSINGRCLTKPNTCTFMYVRTADMNFNMLDCQNYKYAWYSTVNAIIDTFHAYIVDRDDTGLFNDSVFMEMHGGRLTASNLYPDTQNEWFKFSAFGYYNIECGNGFHSTSAVTNAQVLASTKGRITIISFDNALYVRSLVFNDFEIHIPGDITSVRYSTQKAAFASNNIRAMVGSACDPALSEADNAFNADRVCTVLSAANDFTSHLHINPAEGLLYIGGYITFGSESTTGKGYIPVIQLDNAMGLINNTAVDVIWGAFVGTSLNNAVEESDVKWYYWAAQKQIVINKANATELQGKRVYINGVIPIRFANYTT